MKAIVLSAGRGTRLLPWTQDIPKCLIPVDGEQSVLEVQLQTLAACGIRDVTVMAGFGAQHVESFLHSNPVPGLRTNLAFNPFYDVSDNLVTCWLARAEMFEDFVLLNGDTLFEPAVLKLLLASVPAPLTLAVNEKDEYDADDMKVKLDRWRQLRAVGKTLEGEVDAESIGLMVFRGEGPKRFRQILEQEIRKPAGLKAWYLSAVGQMARSTRVDVASITGLWWGEIDSPEDLADVRTALDPAQIPEAPARAAGGCGA
jgi:choline kinase